MAEDDAPALPVVDGPTLLEELDEDWDHPLHHADREAIALRTKKSIDLEIIGLHCSTNGRSCTQHAVCGSCVVVGDLLRLRRTVVTVNGVEEEAYKVVKIEDLAETCTVAFIPRV